MTRATPRLVGSALIGLAGLFFAVLARRPEPAVMAAPFITTALVGLTAMRPPTFDVLATLLPGRVLQGERVVLRLAIGPQSDPGRLRVVLHLPAGLEPAVDEPDLTAREVLVSGPGVDLEWNLTATQWGAVAPVGVSLTATDRMGMSEHRSETASAPVRVMPREETVQRAVAPRSLRSIAGSHLSRQRGDGIEFSDTREFVPGDRARDVNWRVSARRDELWVDQRRPERSGEVVLFLDTFAAVGDSMDNTLRRAVELAGSLTARHIALNDRVGLVDLGGVLRWVRPGGGTVQLYRIVEALIETKMWASGADKTIDVLPSRALPRHSMILAISPLLDEPGVRAITTLRARGFDVAVIEVAAAPFMQEADKRSAKLAGRMWSLQQRAVRADLRSRGIAVAQWRDGEPLDSVLDALGVFRTAVLRSAR